MNTYLIAMYNTKTGHYTPPLLFETVEKATSHMIEELQSSPELGAMRSYLKLFCIGRYDVTTAKIKPYLFKKLLWEDNSSHVSSENNSINKEN